MIVFNKDIERQTTKLYFYCCMFVTMILFQFLCMYTSYVSYVSLTSFDGTTAYIPFSSNDHAAHPQSVTTTD